jgi:hypothetical protein
LEEIQKKIGKNFGVFFWSERFNLADESFLFGDITQQKNNNTIG